MTSLNTGTCDLEQIHAHKREYNPRNDLNSCTCGFKTASTLLGVACMP